MPRAAGGRFTWRVALLGLVLVLGGAGIVARLAYIQVIHHDRYEKLAEEEHLDKEEIRSTRGAILDRNGFPLATSLDVWDLYIDRRAWAQTPYVAEDVANKLAQYLATQPSAVAPGVSLDAGQLYQSFIDPNADPIQLLASGLEYNVGHDIEGLGLIGVTLAGANKRFYPEGDIGSALLGFLGRDHKGLAGLEADLDSMLAGSPGALYFERSGAGQPIAFGQNKVEPGVPGSDVRLTIDRYIQRLIENELDFQVKAHQASGGSIVVMDPKTGAILGMASRPSFKLSELSLDTPDLSLYKNRAVTDLYEPGSVMKTITMATAIDLGLVTPNTTYYDSGTVEKGGYTFKNWDFSANGIQTMTQVLQKSLNTGAIWVSDLIGANNLYASLARFGFGQSTRSGLGGEADGLVRTNKEDGWYSSDLATNSYGQGIAATPLQVITAISSLINGGKLMRPYIISEVDGPDGRRTYDPVVVRQTISPETSATMVQMMNDVVDGVPLHGGKVKGYNVGGKTGTTLVSIPTGYALDSTIASFVGFAPAEDPAFIVLVKIDQPQDDPLGGVVAAPVFGKLAPQILTYMNIPPSDGPLALSGGN
jgi:cell division protein FtsI/penicillin-binding protein 2